MSFRLYESENSEAPEFHDPWLGLAELHCVLVNVVTSQRSNTQSRRIW